MIAVTGGLLVLVIALGMRVASLTKRLAIFEKTRELTRLEPPVGWAIKIETVGGWDEDFVLVCYDTIGKGSPRFRSHWEKLANRTPALILEMKAEAIGLAKAYTGEE